MSVRATLDSNILVYAALEPGSDKGRRAADVIKRAAGGGVLATQALLEFVAVVRRRAPHAVAHAVAQVDAWVATFETAPTTTAVMRDALRLVQGERFQVWDAVIFAAARQAGATLFLSEDMQDGRTLAGMRIVDPFALSHEDIAALLH